MNSRKQTRYDQCGVKRMQSDMLEEESDVKTSYGHSFGDFGLEKDSERKLKIPQGNEITQIVKVSLEELYLGVTKTVLVNRSVICTVCNGTGRHGEISHSIFQQIRRAFSPYNADHMVDPQNRCRNCHGEKLVQENMMLNVDIPFGSQHGEKTEFHGEGNQIPNGKFGTINIVLEQKPHSTFIREGDNLIMKLQINLTESLCGFQRLITLLNGRKVLIDHPPGDPITPYSYRCAKGYGMPNRKTFVHGDLIIQFDVQLPEENFITTDTERKQLEALLPAKPYVHLNTNTPYEQAEIMNYDMSRNHSRKENLGNRHRYQEDGAENGHWNEHTQGIPCATQ